MAMHAPIMGAPLRAPTLGLLSSSDRAAIEQTVEQLIALLDTADGDPDLEDDDPAGDPLDERGEAPSDNGTDLLPVLPRYGDDQTAGPVNERDGLRALRAVQLGLVPTTTGGWRLPS